jgi:hypothetical protein
LKLISHGVMTRVIQSVPTFRIIHQQSAGLIDAKDGFFRV